jgi:hypothetical protein
MTMNRPIRNALTFFRAGDFSILRVCICRQQKAAVASGKSEYRDGIGVAASSRDRPSTADRILKMRKSYGPFKSVDDLRAIKGIGPKRMEKMRKYLTVGKAQPQKRTSPGSHSNSTSPTSHLEPQTTPFPQVFHEIVTTYKT